MPYFNLRVVCDGRTLSDATAADAQSALSLFGGELGVDLTFEGEGAPPYLFEEWSEGPHWINPTTPVFVSSN